MNKFLQIMGVTFRRDPSNFRPRINKIDSILDREQKAAGNHFSLEEWERDRDRFNIDLFNVCLDVDFWDYTNTFCFGK